MSCVPSIPLKIWNRLVRTLRQPLAGSEDDVEVEDDAEVILGEHEIYSQWVAFSDKLHPTGQGVFNNVLGTTAHMLEAAADV